LILTLDRACDCALTLLGYGWWQGLLRALSTWRAWKAKTRVQKGFRRARDERGGGGGGGDTKEDSMVLSTKNPMKINERCKMYLRRVPNTSILVGERDNGRDAGTDDSSCVGESCGVSLVGLDSSWFSFSVPALVSEN
jgi:hypothetical protein